MLLGYTGSPISLSVSLDEQVAEKPWSPLAAKGVGARVCGAFYTPQSSFVCWISLKIFYSSHLFIYLFIGWVETRERVKKNREETKNLGISVISSPVILFLAWQPHCVYCSFLLQTAMCQMSATFQVLVNSNNSFSLQKFIFAEHLCQESCCPLVGNYSEKGRRFAYLCKKLLCN